MERLRKTHAWYLICTTLLVAARVENVYSSMLGISEYPGTEFNNYKTFTPRFYHGRQEKEILSSRDDSENGHVNILTVRYDVDGKHYILDLQLNRDLIGDSYFEKQQNGGQYVLNKPSRKDIEHCHYAGKLRGVANSWAAVSTCEGLRGVVFDGKEVHYLERGPNEENVKEDRIGTHLLYKHSNIKANQTCGYSGTSQNISGHLNHRVKREANIIRGPYNSNRLSRYVEMVLVVDNNLYKEMGSNLSAVSHHCKSLVNIINAIYTPLNIFIVLVGLEVWTENDEIEITGDGDRDLTSFLWYRSKELWKELPNDNAQLLTRKQFKGGVPGKALKGTICTLSYSGAISQDLGRVGETAILMAHELGHNFGMEHDTPECKCVSEACIMAPSYSSKQSTTDWSSCSLEYLALAFEHGMDYCLRNKPTSLFEGPVCGNGFVEAGEECDCGLKSNCNNPCCDPDTCTMYSNATCATGECCDLQTCQIKAASILCRSADHECDLAEYCTGQSEYCPDDVYKMDGEICKDGEAFCNQGSCRTHADQCRLLWGPSGKNAHEQCYGLNKKGKRYGNCGYDMINHTYQQCKDEDIYCGRLHCQHLNERLEFGLESTSILSHTFVNSEGRIIPCRVAIIDLGLSDRDPGLVPNGARCGDGKMCVNQHCVDPLSLRVGDSVCPQNCSGNGICNSLGHCHCKPGFAPPLCDKPGTGGSQDSGPVPSKEDCAPVGCHNTEVPVTSNNTEVSPSSGALPTEGNVKLNNTLNKIEVITKVNKVLNDDWNAAIQEFRLDIDAAVKKLLDKMELKLRAAFVSNSTVQEN